MKNVHAATRQTPSTPGTSVTTVSRLERRSTCKVWSPLYLSQRYTQPRLLLRGHERICHRTKAGAVLLLRFSPCPNDGYQNANTRSAVLQQHRQGRWVSHLERFIHGQHTQTAKTAHINTDSFNMSRALPTGKFGTIIRETRGSQHGGELIMANEDRAHHHTLSCRLVSALLYSRCIPDFEYLNITGTISPTVMINSHNAAAIMSY